MDIHLHPCGGIPFTIEVGYFDTIIEIKEKIRKVKGIPISEQTLVFKGNVLQNQLNVHYSDILDQSHIQLLIAGEFSQRKIQLLVNIPESNSLLVFEMDVKETIQGLKEKIHHIEGIPNTRLVIHANGIELQDSKSLQDCELWHKSNVDVSFRSSSNVGSGPRKLKINVLTRCGTKMIILEVNSLDNVGELKKQLQELNERSQLQLNLPHEGYFFTYKQNVMDDNRSFRWHHVGQGDTIEIFDPTVPHGPC